MRRREFIGLVGAAVWPAVGRAQQSGRTRRIGVLFALAVSDRQAQSRLAVFRSELQKLGWADITIDTRYAASNDAATHEQYAKVLVGIRWYKHAGDAHVARVGRTFVRAQVGIQTGHDRYEMALIVAHEFGHVLGLDHEFGVCATMNPSVGSDHTTLCPAPPSGMWTCRLVQYDDVRGAVTLYGGTVKPWHGSGFCNR